MSEFDSYKKGPLTHLTPELIKAYVAGNLPENLRQKVDDFLKENPFEADALEGLASSKSDLDSALQALESRLEKRISERPSRTFGSWWRLAAAVLLLAVSAIAIYYFIPDRSTGNGLAVDNNLVEDQQPPPVPQEQTLPEVPGDPAQDPDREAGPQSEQSTDRAQVTTTPSDIRDSQTASSKEKKSWPKEILNETAITREVQGEAVKPQAEDEIAEAAEAGIAQDMPAVASERSAAASKISAKTQPETPGQSPNPGDFDSLTGDFKVVVGKVTNYETGSPVAGARIAVKGSSITTVSDQNGFFHLEAPAEARSLISDTQGFHPREIAISEDPQIDVVLQEDQSQADGPAGNTSGKRLRLATDQSSPSAESVLPAAVAPANMLQYLARNTVYPTRGRELGVEGTVVVAFTVLADGSLNDFQILEKVGFGCDEEAVKVLQRGPRWQPARINGKAVPSRGQVSVKFPPGLP